MGITLAGFLVLLTLAVAVLPVPRVRRLLLIATTRLAQAVLLAVLGACGTFFVRPEAAPVWLTSFMAPLLEGAQSVLPFPGGLPWLILAAAVVLVTLPVLIVLELAVSLSRQSSLVQALRKELRLVAAWVDSRLFALGLSKSASPLSQEALAAAEAFRGINPPSAEANGTRVLDLMK